MWEKEQKSKNKSVGASENRLCKAGGTLASWKNSSDLGAPKQNDFFFTE